MVTLFKATRNQCFRLGNMDDIEESDDDKEEEVNKKNILNDVKYSNYLELGKLKPCQLRPRGWF